MPFVPWYQEPNIVRGEPDEGESDEDYEYQDDETWITPELD